MNCYKCGYDIGDEIRCEHCGTDNSVYRSILSASARAYNEGLEYAKIRNLTGAENALNAALRFSKYNTAARNLLGLVHFELGETVLALREWVISLNLNPENNGAERYLNELEYGEGLLDRYDANNRKYNLALSYVKSGSRDLSKIQLKRILKNQPKMVKARNLLALILIQENDYEEARRELNSALRIDSGNPLTISYLKEVQDVLRERNENKKKKKKKDIPISFTDGNDTVVVPRRSLIEALDSSKGGIINILIGLAVGIIATVFLIVPEIRERMNSATKTALVDANESVADYQESVGSLESEVKALKERLSGYEGQSDMKQSYEQLITALSLSSTEDYGSVSNLLSNVNRELLDPVGQSNYDTLLAKVKEDSAKESYENAVNQQKMGNYTAAAALFYAVVGYNENYQDGEALYNLAVCYERAGDDANAVKFYQRMTELYPETWRGRAAAEKVRALSRDTVGTSAQNSGNTANSADNSAEPGNGNNNEAPNSGTGNGNQTSAEPTPEPVPEPVPEPEPNPEPGTEPGGGENPAEPGTGEEPGEGGGENPTPPENNTGDNGETGV